MVDWLNPHWQNQIKEMEEEEAKRLADFKQRKALERNRKNGRRAAHQKMCCRAVSKNYFTNLRGNVLTDLKAAGYFFDEE